MKYSNLKPFLMAIGLALSHNVMSQPAVNSISNNTLMTSEYYSVETKGIKDQYEMEKKDCALTFGNPKKLCNAEALAKQKIDLANLQNDYRPSAKNRYNLAVVKANANYAVSIQKCADMLSGEKASCMREAKIIKTSSLINAKAGRTTPVDKVIMSIEPPYMPEIAVSGPLETFETK